jgi:hypothetical protein
MVSFSSCVLLKFCLKLPLRVPQVAVVEVIIGILQHYDLNSEEAVRPSYMLYGLAIEFESEATPGS